MPVNQATRARRYWAKRYLAVFEKDTVNFMAPVQAFKYSTL